MAKRISSYPGCFLFEYSGNQEFAPMYQTFDSSGFDLVSQSHVTIQPGKVEMIPTGMFLKYDQNAPNFMEHGMIPGSIDIQIRPRSGLSSKGILGLFGTVDCDFEGEIKAGLLNSTDEPFSVTIGMRVAQVVVGICLKMPGIKTKAVIRGEGGFGSTGLK